MNYKLINPMNAIKKAVPFLAFVSLCLLLLGGLNRCTSSQGKGEEKVPAATNSRGVEVISIEKALLTSSLTMPGELISFQQVDLYAKQTSFVKQIYADVGSEVKAGQLLAILEAPEIASQLAGAESRWQSFEAIYIASKANYQRLLETSKTPGTISPNDLDLALSKMNSDFKQLEAAQAAYKEIHNTLDYLTIRAPFGGGISARNVNQGAYVGPTGRGSDNPLFTLQEQKHLRLVVSVPEAYSPFLKEGDEVNFKIKPLPDEFFKAKVTRMAGALDLKLRSQRVEADVFNTDRKLLPGMVAKVTIPLINSDSTFVVPKTAIVTSQERIFVIKVEQGKARWVDVQTGRFIDGRTEIYGSLKEGDQIVKTASEEIRNGSLIIK